jgi:valyl-tRNA synthetase
MSRLSKSQQRELRCILLTAALLVFCGALDLSGPAAPLGWLVPYLLIGRKVLWKAVRNIRAEAEAAPGRKLNLIIRTDSLGPDIEAVAERIRKLANVVDIDIRGTDFEIPSDVMTAVIDGAEIAVRLDDLVDRDAEIERLTKEKARLESEVLRVEKKLANQGFVAKAPQKLVDEEKAKGEKYREMLATVVARLESLK